MFCVSNLCSCEFVVFVVSVFCVWFYVFCVNVVVVVVVVVVFLVFVFCFVPWLLFWVSALSCFSLSRVLLALACCAYFVFSWCAFFPFVLRFFLGGGVFNLIYGRFFMCRNGRGGTMMYTAVLDALSGSIPWDVSHGISVGYFLWVWHTTYFMRCLMNTDGTTLWEVVTPPQLVVKGRR